MISGRVALQRPDVRLAARPLSLRTTSDLYVHTEIEDVAARMAELEVAP